MGVAGHFNDHDVCTIFSRQTYRHEIFKLRRHLCRDNEGKKERQRKRKQASQKKEGREGGEEGRKDGRTEGRKDGRTEGRAEGRKGGRTEGQERTKGGILSLLFGRLGKAAAGPNDLNRKAKATDS